MLPQRKSPEWRKTAQVTREVRTTIKKNWKNGKRNIYNEHDKLVKYGKLKGKQKDTRHPYPQKGKQHPNNTRNGQKLSRLQHENDRPVNKNITPQNSKMLNKRKTKTAEEKARKLKSHPGAMLSNTRTNTIKLL